MIKLIAFDLVGVLVREKEIEMTIAESKLERLFGPNKNDNDYLIEARKIMSRDDEIMESTDYLLNNLYEVKDKKLLEKLKNKYPYIKIIIATNHLSKIRNFILKALDVKYLDAIFISADMNKIKPNKEFYVEIIEKTGYNSDEILFLDDNHENIDGAKLCGLNTIKVNKEMSLFDEINKYIESYNKQ